MKKGLFWLKRQGVKPLILLLILFGVAAHLWRFGSYPNGVNQDEAMSAVDAKAIAEYGVDRYGNSYPVFFEGWKIGQQSAFLNYATALMLKTLPFNERTTRAPMLILSFAGLIALFWTARMLFGKETAWLALALGAISPWHIMQSRWALDCNCMAHMFLIAFAVLIAAVTIAPQAVSQGGKNPNFRRPCGKKAFIFLLLSFFLFALVMYTYGVAFFTVCLFLAASGVFLLFTKKCSFWRLFFSCAIFLIIAAPIFLMMIVNQFDLPSIRLGSLSIQHFPESVRVNDILFFSQRPFSQLQENLFALIDTVILQRRQPVILALPWSGALYLITVPLFLYGLIALFRKIREDIASRCACVLLLIYLGAAILTGLTVSKVSVSRLNVIFYPMLLISAFGLTALRKSRVFRSAMANAMICAYAFSFAFFCYQYFFQYRDEINDAFFKGFREAIVYADNHSPDCIAISNRMFEHDYFMVSEILTQYHLKMDSAYYRGETGERIAENGERYHVPYAERYHYVSSLQEELEKFPACAIVFQDIFDDAFREKGYEFRRFANFMVGIPKK